MIVWHAQNNVMGVASAQMTLNIERGSRSFTLDDHALRVLRAFHPNAKRQATAESEINKLRHYLLEDQQTN